MNDGTKQLTRTTMVSTQENKMTMGTNGDERWLGRLRVIGWGLVVVLLALPAIGMQVSDEVNWSAGDFVFAAVLLIGTGLLVELAVRRNRDNNYRAGAVLALFTTLLLAWINAAVGFVGSGANPANTLYVALIGVAFAGSFAVGFQAAGMAKAMIITAVGQGLITIMAFATGLVRVEEIFIIIVVNGFFIGLWSTAAVLFKQAAKGTPLSTRQRLLLPMLFTALGLSLMVYMVVVEDEPTAVPLLLVLGGMCWAGVTVLRERMRR